jgi:hypothetical protein
MFGKNAKLYAVSAALAALILLTVFLTTCDSPLGFGDPVDWEAPVLVLDPGTNPRYVRQNTKLTGTVSDNISLDRVILRDAISGERLFTAVLTGNSPINKTWEITLEFSEARNGEKIAVEIVAYDRAGNSGDASIAAISLIIDIREPVTTDIYIERTSSGKMKTALLEPLEDLRLLETSDPRGEISGNVNRYQNGSFKIRAKLDENETRIEDVKLYLYDVFRNPGDPLLALEREENTSIFSPTWSLNEEDILAAGAAKGWSNYAANYDNGQRYYYQVIVVASDRSGNELYDDMKTFCLWADGDIPKGIIDPTYTESLTEVFVPRGEPLPVEFFDDDGLEWAYAGLLTQAQWEGAADVYTGSVKIPDGSDEDKLNWLKARLVDQNQGVYNWNQDKHSTVAPAQKEIINQVGSAEIDEKIINLQTGNAANDSGEFILFTLTADKKLPPHDPAYSGNKETFKSRWQSRFWRVQVIDENAPLIVFDTVNGSPEENTFPQLTGGRNFNITGYTLRENGNGNNAVEKFRMAWIPYNMPDGPDSHIKAVQDALQNNYPAGIPAGVVHWDLSAQMAGGTERIIGDIKYLEQSFQKAFNILADFMYNNQLENEIKLFIFYAEDNMAHETFRQLRLLGNKTPPTITIYDLTTMDAAFGENYNLASPPQLPNLNWNTANNNGYYFFNNAGVIDNAGRERYRQKLLAYQATGYGILRSLAMTNNTLNTGLSEAEPNAAYPRETTVKYWVAAKSNGDLEIKNIQMRDATFSTTAPYNAGSYVSRTYNQNSQWQQTVNGLVYTDPVYTDPNNTNRLNDLSLSYVEMLPEVTQKVFVFTASDSLGNTVNIQRTVAVTNAAVLKNITTIEQTGSFGIGQKITLQANFTNLVTWEGSAEPLLNVRYNRGATAITTPAGGTPTIVQIKTKTPANTPTLYLEFDLEVAEGDVSTVQTMYSDIPTDNKTWTLDPSNPSTVVDRPITLPSGTQILDASRKDPAFTPLNVAGFNWTNAGRGPNSSLQYTKTITLQGIRPTISSFVLNPPAGKTQHTDNPNQGYYFKADETIEFQLTANHPIFTSGTPIIEFQVGAATQYRSATWVRSSGANAMVFSVLVNSANTPDDGAIPAVNGSSIRLANVSAIVDSVGNAFAAGAGVYSPTVMNISTGNNTIRIDKTAPAAPTTTLTANSTTVTAGALPEQLYNVNPVLAIPNNTSGETAPVTTQYSLNNGVTWVDFPTPTDGHSNQTIRNLNWTSANSATALNILNGQWTLVTRYKDRAGNEGAPTTQPLHVNVIFPNLIAVTAVQSNGWYKTGANLSFTLDFADPVRVDTAANVQIVLTNRGSTPYTTGTGENNILLSAATSPSQADITRTGNTSITFNWTNITGDYEMRDGMYISYIRLAGLRDRFGNPGPGANLIEISYNNGNPNIGTHSGTLFANPAISNLGTGVKVDNIAPAVTSAVPYINTATPGTPVAGANGVATTIVSQANNDFRNRITLTFREPVMKGNGTITIKPQKDFYVPPVFENNGYYLDQFTGTGANIWQRPEQKVAANTAGRTTWVPGFYDIYNSGLTAAQRNALTESTSVTSQNLAPSNGNYPSDVLETTNPSMSRLRLDRRTGQSVGPYVKTTQGLVTGAGYTGNYAANTGANAPAPAGSFLVPDTATKWVLAYPYSISNEDNVQYSAPADAAGDTLTTPANTVVPAIRAALVAAKFRWQEIDVISSDVTISGNTVTITLTEPLLKGLQWELSYTAGTFTDMAGNAAPALAAETYVFWSPGAQKPVIRVDRKSYDARNANWQVPTSGNNSTGYTYNNPSTASGWGITSFNTINYRIETETPGATISHGNYGRAAALNSTNAASANGPFYAITGDYTGDVARVNQGGPTGYTQSTWNHGQTTNGEWVRPNLIRRGSAGSYTVNGVTRTFVGTYRGIRSYNADVSSATLTGLGLTSTNTGNSRYRASLDFANLEAGKSYVAATAVITNGTEYTSNRGYEGVFRTVIALAYNTGRSNTRIVVQGSNIKNGMPSISGFPVQDAAETGDSRFVKMFYSNSNTQFYWVSTEIVSEWYFIKFGGGNGNNNNGSHMSDGEVNNYLTVGYGDLTYAWNIISSGEAR